MRARAVSRRSGSSSCLLLPRASIVDRDENTDENTDEKRSKRLSVTMVNTVRRPTYACERFYMLSELELKSQSTIFLSDYYENDGDTADTAAESDNASQLDSGLPPPPIPGVPSLEDLPSYFMLYILWRPDGTTTVDAFIQDVVKSAVLQLHELGPSQDNNNNNNSNSNINNNNNDNDSSSINNNNNNNDDNNNNTNNDNRNIYLIVDISIPQNPTEQSATNDNDNDNDNNTPPETSPRESHFHYHTQHTAEQMARQVSLTLRTHIQGITVGLADHPRAAPGLEACMEAVSVGTHDRRRHNHDKSAVGVVAISADDLIGDQVEADAAQGVLQSITAAEWNGYGDLECFSKRAHQHWCQLHNVVPLEKQHQQYRTSMMYPGMLMHQRRRRRRRRRIPNTDHNSSISDPISLFMILMFVGWIILHVTTTYNDMLKEIAGTWDSILDTTKQKHRLDAQQMLEGHLGDDL